MALFTGRGLTGLGEVRHIQESRWQLDSLGVPSVPGLACVHRAGPPALAQSPPILGVLSPGLLTHLNSHSSGTPVPGTTGATPRHEAMAVAHLPSLACFVVVSLVKPTASS